MAEERPITYWYQGNDPAIDYVFDLIFKTLGLIATRSPGQSGSGVDLTYGELDPKRQGRLHIERRTTQQDRLADQMIWRQLLDGHTETADRIVRFDIIHAIHGLLSDVGNRSSVLDEHHRVEFEGSFQAQHEIVGMPLANLYIEHLRAVFSEHLSIKPKSLLPSGKSCAIILSHDVDGPDKACTNYWTNHYAGRTKEALAEKDFLEAGKNTYRLLRQLARSALTKPDYWLFEEIMDEEAKRGMQSTFFFATRNALDPKAHPQIDVYYDAGEAKFRRTFESIKSHGHEIALHQSYYAYKSTQMILEEKELLESYSGIEVVGGRHHYWSLGPNPEHAFCYDQEAGFLYDSSVCFNDRMGFRRSIASPYYPWSVQNAEPVKVMEIPNFLMDGHFFYRNASQEEFLDQLREQLAVIKKNRGICSVDWHVRTSLPKDNEYREWGRGYLALLDLLAEDSEFWVTSARNVWEHIHQQWLQLEKEAGEATQPLSLSASG